LVAHVGDGQAEFVLHLADEIDASVFGAAATGQSQLTPRNLDDHGDKILGPVQLKVIDLHDNGQVRNGIAQHQRILELPFLVGGSELAELLAGEIAAAIIELGGYVFERDTDLAEPAV